MSHLNNEIEMSQCISRHHIPVTWFTKFLIIHMFKLGTAVAQWLRCCDTNRNVAGSIPDGVIGIFH